MIRIILSADKIPLGSKVSKRGGEKMYTLRDRLCLWDETGKPMELRGVDGSRVIVAADGNANIVCGTTDLVWYADEDAVIDLLLKTDSQ